jgi:hypothetical protein
VPEDCPETVRPTRLEVRNVEPEALMLDLLKPFTDSSFAPAMRQDVTNRVF